MLTLRFENHCSGAYQVYSCERYSVAGEGECGHGGDAKFRRIVRMYRSLEDDNPYFEYIGDEELSGICYVMNDAGQTVDTIRSP